MVQYKYLVTDLLTDQVNLEPSVFGVNLGRRMSKPGNGTFSIGLDGSNTVRNQNIIDFTAPGRNALWVLRDDVIVWGGVIWSRTYQSQARVLQYTAQTFESFLYKQFIEDDYSWEEIDQRQILVDLINFMQAKTGANINIDTALSFDPLNAVIRTENMWLADRWSFGKAAEYLVNYADGFEYYIDWVIDANGNLSKALVTDNTVGVSLASSQIAFDYPGNVTNYWFPETVSDAAVTVLGSGSGQGAGMTMSKYTHADLITGGWPDLQIEFSNRDVSEQETLDSQTTAEAMRVRPPMTTIQLELNGRLGTIADISLGDWCRVKIEDVRFPSGYSANTRIIGWDLKPPTSESEEYIKLVVAGDESG